MLELHRLSSAERRFGQNLMRLVGCNHFLPERIQLEREVLGADFVEGTSQTWALDQDRDSRNANLERLSLKVGSTLESIRARLSRGSIRRPLDPADHPAYQALVHYFLYRRYRPDFRAWVDGTAAEAETARRYESFADELREWIRPLGTDLPEGDVALRFGGFAQIERAFINIFSSIVGTSPSIALLRAGIWESVFTANLDRYRGGVYRRMNEIATLILGPSGTGKELVAQAIARSAFIPFDPRRRRFLSRPDQLFLPLNLPALSSNLIESELFGHRRGAFTGAIQDRPGWFEVCPDAGAVFLDEIGEVDASLQVKLLRMLQSRSFHRLGETQARPFRGRILAATHRDLAGLLADGRFREDFYYRICSDTIRTPSLATQLGEAPGDLPALVRFVAERYVAREQLEGLTTEASDWIERHLGRGYAWPGNFRELEQCVRSILVRARYQPLAVISARGSDRLREALDQGTLTAEQLLVRYCHAVHARTGNLQETARRLDLDWRTVKAKLARNLA